MGASYYLTADRTLPGVLGAQLDGKALAHLDHVLECHGAYAQMGLRPLSEFFGDVVDLDGLSSEFDDEIQNEHVGEETWFYPADGLEVVHAVRQFLAVRDPLDPRQDNALEELDELERALLVIQASAARWHLSIDI